MYEHDERIVMTLDAGGTNFVFSAMQGCREIIDSICLPAVSDNLEHCLSVLVEGFLEVEKRLPKLPVAISFAFPGPADYEHGIIGDLPNFPAFRGGVALGPYLEEQFGIPVFINNDNSDIDFLLYHLNNSRLFLRFSTMQKLGGTRVRLYYKNLITYKLAVPTVKEQQAIGIYFSNLDNLINSHQEKISQLETLKKKLLQDMLN